MVTLLYFVEDKYLEQSRAWLMSSSTTSSDTSSLQSPIRLVAAGREVTIYVVTTREEAHRHLLTVPVDLLVLEEHSALDETICFRFLKGLHYLPDPDQAFPLNRVAVVLCGKEHLVDRSFRYGRFNVAKVLAKPRAVETLITLLAPLVENQESGKLALCLGGGGLEGLLYELGVCKALDDVLVGRSLHRFDIFCGISAGSILATFLAFGFDLDDILDAFEGGGQGSLDPITPAVLYDPAILDWMLHAVAVLAKTRSLKPKALLSTFLRMSPRGLFKGARLRQYLSLQFKNRGLSEDFAAANRELYIGATNQDTSEHVVFGAEGFRDVPVSRAIRASCALTPFYLPERIGATWYADGQITRTANFHWAMERGAKLVIVVNPLRPIESGEPGYVHGKGGLFEALQSLKALINTRFLHALNHQIERCAEQDVLLFQPYREDMKLMSGSPMKYSIRREIIRLAYNAVIRKLNTDFEFYRSTLNRHGLELRRGRVLETS
ncbi:MAG: hypothetical protein A2284_11395 [Deltaproteobacteria bacterium RIFOXYA12_FULL_61_11]|nr:MAG: hypothetical protein A2284_11395 [Deltaproteobacteria bacterium RIFOXYA12_FULL_61_11]